VTLSASDENYRIGKVTGSLVNILMTATSEAALIKAWREKVGLDPPPAETYAMRAGSHMESLILAERELQTGQKITRRGEIIDHPSVKDVCVKLDGWREADDSIVEVKFIAPWRQREEFVPAYYAQCILQMLCTGAKNGTLVVGQGTSEPVEHEIVFDEDYAGEMMRRIDAFLECMRKMRPPYPEPPIIPPSKWRTVDLDAEPTNWAPDLINHLEHYAATAEMAQLHGLAGSAARKLVPDDVGKVLVRQWQITRDRRGILSIRDRRNAA
jgi:hypothetical protein